MNKKLDFFILLVICYHIIACSTGNEKQVVVYTSVDQVFAEPILKDFENETGIKVNAVFDTEEAKSTGVLNRLIAEKNQPQCDVFWSGDPIRADLLKQKGISTAYQSLAAQDLPDIFKDKDDHWTGFSARARVLLVNTNLVPDSLIPSSILDLSNAKYKNKVAIANPLFGTTSFHIAALFTVIGDENAKKWLRDIKNNEIIIATSNGDVKKKVVNGEVWIGLTDTDDANEAIKEGAPVKMIFLDQNEFGNLINPNTVSLIRNSPQQANGKRVMDYLLSRETEEKLAKSCAQMPLHKGVPVPASVPVLDSIKPMKVDYQATALKYNSIKDFLKKWVEE